MKKIKSIRQQMGLTQQELAEKANLSLRTIQRLESGKSEPKGYTLKVLSKALNMTPSQLVESYENTNVETIQHKIKIINLSTLAFLGIPYGNILLPVFFWRKYRKVSPEVNEAGKKIINFQILWSIVFYLFLGVSPFIQPYLSLGFPVIFIVLLLGIIVNVICIYRFANQITRGTFQFYNMPVRLI